MSMLDCAFPVEASGEWSNSLVRLQRLAELVAVAR